MIAILAVILPAGCGKDKPCGHVTSTILPLELGKQWVGTVTDFDSQGAVNYIDTMAFVITRDTIISGERWFIREGINEGPNKDGDSYVGGYSILAERGDGIWTHMSDSTTDWECLLHKYPAAAGDSYFYCGDSALTIAVLSTNESVSVPAGNYQCYCYRMQYNFSDFTAAEVMYLAPDIGMVKLEGYFSQDGGEEYLTIQWVLDSFL
jgi:hypothetical protein